MSNTPSAAGKAFQVFRKALECLCGAMMLAITVIVFVQVFNRFVLKSSFAWAEEAGIYLMIWLVFLGASVNILRDSNIRIDFFIRLLPARVRP